MGPATADVTIREHARSARAGPRGFGGAPCTEVGYDAGAVGELAEAVERAKAVHRLSEIVTVVLLNLSPLLERLQALQAVPEMPEAARTDLDAAVEVVREMREACARSIDVFDHLRRVL